MALGAGGGQVLRLMLRGAFAPILWGMLAGLVVSAGASRLLSATLFGLSPWDAVSYSGVSALLAGVALVAIMLPALRATRVDPMVALRYE
jgi:ABC-type antimicrobial peptide transport system permease subunit